MENILAGLEGSVLAQTLRSGRWSYAAVNTAHIFGIALLFGAIVPLNLRLLGVWHGRMELQALARVLVPVAATGLSLALVAGFFLFSARAGDYADNPFFLAKLTLATAGLLSALAFHLHAGWWLEGAGRRQMLFHATVSSLCWAGAIACGRLIAFSQ